ncbi:hypothetical protein NT6N_17280 [Oceaniferula spumae]|uniref:Phosphate-selective porin O and P n=1 Tax=Oceaniferula spumae TaxID=2979115 RepID=A0AAT9FL66_9BACT
MIPKKLTAASICAISLAGLPAIAGEAIEAPKADKPSNNGNWCSWLQDDPGKLYDNDDNPFIQEFTITGRFHWQYAYVDGQGSHEGGIRRLSYDTEEIRRFRLGVEMKFLNFFKLETDVDLANDLAPTGLESDHDIEYADIYSATLTFDAQEAFEIKSLDKLDFSIGKHKVTTSAEKDISSREIKTVERSSLSDYITPPSSTGFAIDLEKGPWEITAGIYSGDDEDEFADVKGDNDYFYTFRLGYKAEDPKFFDKAQANLRVIINGDESENATDNPLSEGAFNPDWAVSFGTQTRKGRFDLLTDVIYGENGKEFSMESNGLERRPEREGSFWGVVILPSYWLVEDRLEAVFRYQYAESSQPEGFRISSRYSRRAGESLGFTGPNDLSNGRGDNHHSAYLGLNYYLCGDNAKVMFGVEYDDLDSGSQDVYEGYTGWAAFRMYF